MENLQEELISALRKHWIPAILALLALIFFVYGMISFLGKTNSPEVAFDTEPSSKSEAQIAVDVEGAVVNPGVYRLKPDSLLQDALIAAGGASEDADRDWMQKNLNLASKLTAGQKIYIAKQGETGTITLIQDVEGNSSGLININSASESELDSLSGVGPVTSRKIIAGRPYASINELVEKKIVGQATFDKIKDKITAQ